MSDRAKSRPVPLQLLAGLIVSLITTLLLVFALAVAVHRAVYDEHLAILGELKVTLRAPPTGLLSSLECIE